MRAASSSDKENLKPTGSTSRSRLPVLLARKNQPKPAKPTRLHNGKSMVILASQPGSKAELNPQGGSSAEMKLLRSTMEHWRLRMHREITNRHMQISAAALDRQRLLSHAFQLWAVLRHECQLNRLLQLKSDRHFTRVVTRSMFHRWRRLDRSLANRNHYSEAMLEQIDSRRRRTLLRRYFYGWQKSEQFSSVNRRQAMLALLLWSRRVYRSAWQQWRERYCYRSLHQLVEQRAVKIYQISLLTATMDRWRMEIYYRFNERLLEERADRIHRRLVLYRFAGCWLRRLNELQVDRVLGSQATRFQTGWLLAKSLHRWRLRARIQWNQEHRLETEQSAWMLRAGWARWLALTRRRLEMTCQSIELRAQTAVKLKRSLFNRWISGTKQIIKATNQASNYRRRLQYTVSLNTLRERWQQHRADYYYQRSARSRAFSALLRRFNYIREITARAELLWDSYRQQTFVAKSWRKLECHAHRIRELCLIGVSLRQHIISRRRLTYLRLWHQKSLETQSNHFARWKGNLLRRMLNQWLKTAGGRRSAAKHYQSTLQRAALTVWRTHCAALQHRQAQQVFDYWLGGRMIVDGEGAPPIVSCATPGEFDFRPAIEQSMHITDVDEEISFIQDRLMEYQRELEVVQRDRALLLSPEIALPAKKWKYDLLMQKVLRYDSHDSHRRRDIRALSDRLLELKAVVQRKF